MALLEPECGVLMARRAVRTLAADLVQSRRPSMLARTVAVAPHRQVRVTSLLLADGAGVIAAMPFVFACGAWLPSVFRDDCSPAASVRRGRL